MSADQDATTPDARPGPASAWLSGHADELRTVVDQLVGDGDRIDAWGAHLGTVLAGGGRLLTAGNGGSAAEAQHLTAELVGRFVGERRPLSAIALHADTSSVTAVANDYGAREVFARGVTAHGRPGDVLLLLSASGRSENVLAAAAAARQAGLTVWSLTGPGPNPLGEVSDDAVCLVAPTTSAVQEGHLVAVHALCAAVDARVRALDAAGTGTPASTGPARSTTVTTTARTADVTTDSADVGATRTGEGARAPGEQRGEDPRPRASSAPGPVGTRAVRLVVVGDVVLDRDVLGTAERVAPDAPVPVVDVGGTRESPGGAGLTALLCEDAGVSVTLVAPLADDEAGARLRTALETGGVGVHALGHDGATRTKTRVRVAGQSLVRLDDGGSGAPLAVDAAALGRTLEGADVVLVSDYGAGTTHEPAVRAALERSAARVPVVWDPHPRGGEPVAGCALVTPNAAEAVRALGDAATQPQQTCTALRRRWAAGAVAVTAGARGAFVARATPSSRTLDATDATDATDAALYVPAPPVASGDPAGAGDRFAASAAIALARGADPASAVAVAVDAASAWVDAGGASGWRERVRRASRSDQDAAPTASAGDPSPGGEGRAALALADRVRATGGALVATGGCFDVLHAGHVTMLDGAARLGDALVVLLNSDASVRRLKGPGRPVNTAADRAEVLLALGSVDAVLVFDEDDPRDALDGLRPHVWVKGGDYALADLPEAPLVRGWGGEVVLLPHLAGRSTTSTLARGAASALPPDHDLTEAPA